MGLFSTEKITTVGTTVARAIEDDNLPDSIKSGLIKGIFENGDIGSYILEEMMGSVAVRAERMYEYGRTKYTYGLPSGTVYAATQGTEEVETILEMVEAQPIVLDYSRFGSINLFHVGWMRLVSDHDYSPDTNQFAGLTAQKGKPVYLQSLQVVLSPASYAATNAASLERWSTPSRAGISFDRPTLTSEAGQLSEEDRLVVDPDATEDHVLVTVVWEDPTYHASVLEPEEVRYKTETLTIPLAGFDGEADYFHAKYVCAGVTKFWLYEAGTGQYPTLDAVFDAPPDVTGSYFPFLYFRYAKKSMADLEGTDAYKTSKKLAKYLGIDYADMVEAIHENPDIKDVEQAMLVLAVPANTEDPVEQRYLFDYFSAQYLIQNPEQTSRNAATTILYRERTLAASRNVSVIQDARFKMTLGNNGIFKRLISGSIGEVGSYSGGYRTRNERGTYYETGAEGPVDVEVPIGFHYYQHQITDVLYEEIEVREMRMTYHIFGKYTETGDDEETFLLVPVDRSIAGEYSMPVREKLYSRSLHYVFNSRVVTKLKWYQQDWFRVVLIIAAIIITIWTQGAAIKESLALIAAATIGTAILMVTVKVILWLLTRYAVKLFVKAIGEKFAFIAAIIAVVAAAYGIIDSGSLAGAPWAEDLLLAANLLTSGVSDVVQDSFALLADEAKEFGIYAEEQNKLLETANDLLESNSLLSPFVIFGESPNDFYNRTVHSGNIGVVGISAIESFVDVALTLPTLNETIGAAPNGYL